MAWRLVGILIWPFPTWGKLLRLSLSSETRVLAIWDTRAQPYAIGDMLVFMEGTLVAREEHNAAKVDVCILSDERQYKLPSPDLDEITADNRFRYTLSLLRLVQVNPHFGSLFFFDSKEHMEAFVADNAQQYAVWPPIEAYVSKEYLTHTRVFEMVADHFRKTGEIPYLSSNASTKQWAESFLAEHRQAAVPVVVQIRKNNAIDTRRNSNIESWVELFNHCQSRLPITFFVVCGIDEVDPRLRERSNVVVAKDFGTTVEQDLALIECSAFFMASISGMAAMAFFGKMPYAIMNVPLVPHHPDVFPTVMEETGTLRLLWAASHQKLLTGTDDILVLIRECHRLLESIDPGAWHSTATTTSETAKKLRLW